MKQLTRNYVHELRQNMTDAEKHLWHFLRAKQLNGHKIRRQHLIYPFIVESYCQMLCTRNFSLGGDFRIH